MNKYHNITAWGKYIKSLFVYAIMWHKPWHTNVARFVGTERENSDYLVQFLNKSWIKPISYSTTVVHDGKKERFCSVLIYKYKKIK